MSDGSGLLTPGRVTTLPWCVACGIEHDTTRSCPREIDPTGPERPGWRITVETPTGHEAYGILLAPIGSRWRARIMTFPRMLWLVPGGRTTVKFLGQNAPDAEEKAVGFIREHCYRRGYKMRDEFASVEPDIPAPVRPIYEHQHPRFFRELKLRFGPSMPTIIGSTRDVSENGLFVATPAPLARSAGVGILLQLEHCAIPLRGDVRWCRNIPALHRPVGMGIQLLDPPKDFIRYVHALE